MNDKTGIQAKSERLRRAIEVRRLIEVARTEDGYPKTEDIREALNAARYLMDGIVVDLTEELLDTLDQLKEN